MPDPAPVDPTTCLVTSHSAVGGGTTDQKVRGSRRRETTDVAGIRQRGERFQVRIFGGIDPAAGKQLILTGYSAKTLPGVREAIEAKNWTEANQQAQRLAATLRSAATQVYAATQALQQTR